MTLALPLEIPVFARTAPRLWSLSLLGVLGRDEQQSIVKLNGSVDRMDSMGMQLGNGALGRVLQFVGRKMRKGTPHLVLYHGLPGSQGHGTGIGCQCHGLDRFISSLLQGLDKHLDGWLMSGPDLQGLGPQGIIQVVLGTGDNPETTLGHEPLAQSLQNGHTVLQGKVMYHFLEQDHLK